MVCMNDSVSEFVMHIPCNSCGSSDGNSLYDDGHTFCFVCQSHSQSQYSPPTQLSHAIQLQGSAERLQKRNITQATCELFKTYKDGDTLRHYYFDEGKVVGAKLRTKGKDFRCEGEVKTLFGMQNYRKKTTKKDTKLVITEGEMDCMAVWEAQPNWDVVSIPNGAPSSKKAIQNNYEWINGYDKIVLFFDNDAAGREGAEACAGVLPPGKVYLGFLEAYKDASDALQAGDTEAIRAVCNYDHKQFRPDGIVEAKNLLELVTTPTPPSDHDYPFDGLQQMLHGIRLGELTTITAGSGIGKSSFCRELAAHLLKQDVRVGYMALEESVRRTSLGLMSAAVGKALHLGEPTHEELTEAFDKTIKEWNLFLFEGFGSYDRDVIYNRIEYLACGLDCKVIFLDHLSILMSGLDGDERRMIDQTMTKLRSLVERTGISLFLVCHTTTPANGQSHEEGGRVQLRSLRGSRSIGQLSDNVIALERDQQSESDGNSTIVRCLKNRNSGEVGIASQLIFDLETCSFTEHEKTKAFDPTTDF